MSRWVRDGRLRRPGTGPLPRPATHPRILTWVAGRGSGSVPDPEGIQNHASTTFAL